MKRVETVLLTEEEFKAFKTVQKILDDLDFSNWTTDAMFVSEVAAGRVNVDISDDSTYHTRSIKIEIEP